MKLLHGYNYGFKMGKSRKHQRNKCDSDLNSGKKEDMEFKRLHRRP